MNDTTTEKPEKPENDPSLNGQGNIIAALEAYISPVLQTTFRGIMTANVVGIPPPLILITMSRMCGFLLSAPLQGDLTSVLGVRSRLKEEFNKGIQLAKIVPPNPEVAGIDMLEPTMPPRG